MILNHKIGLIHTLDNQSPVLHSSLYGENVIGRVSDLALAWCQRERALSIEHCASIRITIQALVEFGCTEKDAAIFEFAVDENHVYIAVRTPLILDGAEDPEKYFSQFWMNSSRAALLRKLMLPHDRIEVRHNRTLNIVEWRLCRKLNPAGEVPGTAFVVIVDEESALSSTSGNYIELGDLPFEEWLKEVHQPSSEATMSNLLTTVSKAGTVSDLESAITGSSGGRTDESVLVSGQAKTQDQTERRFSSGEKAADNETKVIDGGGGPELDDTKTVFKASHDSTESDVETIIEAGDEEPEEVIDLAAQQAAIENACNAYIKEIEDEFNTKKVALQAEARETIRVAKMNEIRAQRELEVMKSKLRKAEKATQLKEKQFRQVSLEVPKLRQVIADTEQKASERVAEFRDKATNMYEMLKKAKEQNKALEGMLAQANSSGVKKDENDSAAIANSKYMEELTKKLERTTRALETEKGKVKSLSERVMIAEKEAQNLSPLIGDLEKKAENSMKLVQASKKETEAVKQKLVQSEAEKNKVKNELSKANAQIQTLMKRQAA